MKAPTLLSLALVVGCGSRAKEVAPPAPPSGEAWLTDAQVKDGKIDVAPMADQNVGGAVVTPGKVTFDDLRVSHIFSPVTGRVTQILAQPGQRVKKDQALVVIQSPDVGQAFADLAKAHADLEQADKDFRRQKELYEGHAASEKDYEAAKASRDKANAELERSRRKAALLSKSGADSVTQEYTLRSQIDGEVIVRNVNPGNEVQGTYGGGSPLELFTVGEIDRVWVMADVFEQDVGLVKQGARVTVRVIAYPDKPFTGVVDVISGTLDANSRTAKVRCTIDNPQRQLKPEMYATVSIAVAERRELAIPKSALLRLGDSTVVFVETGKTKDGLTKFERRPVHVDEDEGGDFLPVTHGLQRGERIVVAGAILLSGMM